MVKAAVPDIVVKSPDGDYLVVIEVKLKNTPSSRQLALEQLKHYMTLMDCPTGLAIVGSQAILLRDSFEKFHGESISVVSEATLPDNLKPSISEYQHVAAQHNEFEMRIQQWLQRLQENSRLEELSPDLQKLFGESLMNLLRFGEIHVASPIGRKAK